MRSFAAFIITLILITPGCSMPLKIEAGVKTNGILEYITGVEAFIGIRVGNPTDEELIREMENKE